MKILYMANVPSPYRVDFFNEFGKHCDLTVLFESKTSSIRDKSWESYEFNNFKGIFLKGKHIKNLGLVSFEAIKYIKSKTYDHIICSDFSSPTGTIAIEYMKRHHIRYWLESDGGFAKNGKGYKEKIKRLNIRGAYGYFSTAKEHDNYYTTYGADAEKLHRYPFTSLKSSDVLNDKMSARERQALRDQLGMKEENIIISIGQFVYRKGFDVLIKSAAKIKKDIGIYIIGGDPTQEYLDMKKKYGVENIHFVGFKLKDELKNYYEAADLFVLPTREDIWGLVINEAMAYGLPVITTNRCIAGLELVKNGKNGYIVESENVDEFADRINGIFNQSELCDKMGNYSLEIIKHYTIENMSCAHLKILANY